MAAQFISMDTFEETRKILSCHPYILRDNEVEDYLEKTYQILNSRSPISYQEFGDVMNFGQVVDLYLSKNPHLAMNPGGDREVWRFLIAKDMQTKGYIIPKIYQEKIKFEEELKILLNTFKEKEGEAFSYYSQYREWMKSNWLQFNVITMQEFRKKLY